MSLDRPLAPVPIEAIEAACARIAGIALRTPLVPLDLGAATPGPVFLKLESLQPIGSFKLRGALNAIAARDPESLARGVWTASAGNMAQGVAHAARTLGLACTVVMPEHAPAAKRDAVVRLGGRVVSVPFDDWWRAIERHTHPGQEGAFVHPVCDPEVVAGNGTIGLEILEELPEVATVLAPYGGGGLACGIASALAARRPQAAVYACEVATAAPFAASLEAGEAVAIDHVPSFVDGIGGKSVLAPMWPAARALLAGSLVVSLDHIAAAIRLLVARARVVAEGAGAASVAAASQGRFAAGPIVCVVSGGNLDAAVLSEILAGRTPAPASSRAED